jgi:hypothetical protein
MTLFKRYNLCCQRVCPRHVLASFQLSHLINYPSSVPISFSRHSLCPSPGLQPSSLISWGCEDAPHLHVCLCMVYCFFRGEPVGATQDQPHFNPRLGLRIGATRRNSYTFTLADICGCKDERRTVKLGVRRNRRRRRLTLLFHPDYVHSKCEALSETQEDKKPYSTINKRRWGSSVSIATGYGLGSRSSVPSRGNIFFPLQRPDQLWGPCSLLFNGYGGGGVLPRG